MKYIFSVLCLLFLSVPSMYAQGILTPNITILEPRDELTRLIAGSPLFFAWKTTSDIPIDFQVLSYSLDGGKTFFDIIITRDTKPVLSGFFFFLDRTIPLSSAFLKVSVVDIAGNKGEQQASFGMIGKVEVIFYTKSSLVISGLGLSSYSTNPDIQVFINNKQISTKHFKLLSNSSLLIRGNKQFLNLIYGYNTIFVYVDGVKLTGLSEFLLTKTHLN